ncbi:MULTISPECIES: membrane protein insertase YidC [unclassified Haematospirillum]|uniref:membrane protein insertase YidC n=1 Tax=unclassified Haematospirillum TaxID=2622088 RepID=UPI00143A6367|nr:MULTISPECIES: membrane protein insertase YidC [unclassified Haematospirillum]NKD55271.1 membrane protein insertase YidC [Haematospirillum sp. H4890]NKD75156.1 membrane protein insertase YidC [Haematospirillum sp. H4485]
MPEQKNFILAMVLMVAILAGFEYFAPTPPAPVPVRSDATIDTTPGPVAADPGIAAPTGPRDRNAVLAEGQRVRIDTPSLSGSLSLHGGRIDDLTLKAYREQVDPHSANIVLLNPKGSERPHYAEFGWVSANPAIKVPGPDAHWRSEGGTLTENTPVTLVWKNDQGLVFRRVVSVDPDFLFTITDSVENTGPDALTLYPYGLVSRGYTPRTEGFYILHEGPLGVLDGTLKEITYQDLRDERHVDYQSTGGWIGITDKYWLTAIDLPKGDVNKARFVYTGDGHDRYQSDFLGSARTVAPGETITTVTDFFAGAKKVDLLDRYAREKGIDRFDLAIDFGWFYFLTKPFFIAIQFLYGFLGNFGLAILAFTVALRLVLYPLANKSYKAMNRMKILQPKVKELQERFQDDRVRMQQEMMALYRDEKVNPLAGCLPILIQIPIFFALYKVLFVALEMRHAPFYGFITDLSAPDPTNLFTLFGLIPWNAPSFLHLGILPIIMGITMWFQQKLNPAPADPVQAKVMMFLPVLFTFMLAGFPAGLVIYWAWNNILSIAQQWSIMRRHDEAPAHAGRT